MKTNRLPAILTFLLTPSFVSAQWTSSGNDIINTNAGNVRINNNGFLIGRGHVFFYPYEGENANGTVYLQAVQPSNTGTSINLQLRTQNAGQLIEALHIRADGNVGIGTTNPEARMHINSTVLSTGSGSGFKFRDWKAGATANDDWHIYAANGSARIHKVNVGDLFTLTEAGNMGLGNANPPAKLSVNGDIYSRGHMFFYPVEGENANGTAYLQARTPFQTSTSINLQLRTQNAGQVVEAMHVLYNGNVGIGTTQPGNYKLAVNGTIAAREIKVTANGWADFVFTPAYSLPKLPMVEAYIRQHGHLPQIPSEAEVATNGIAVGEMQTKLLQKVEELTLYVIQQQKEIKRLRQQVNRLDKAHALKKYGR